MAKTKEIDMTYGDPYKLIIKFSIPLLIGSVIQTLYNTVDSIVVGQMIGEKALAAVGAGLPFLFIMLSLFIGLGMAGTVIVATYFGAKDYDNLNKTVGTLYKLGLILIIPLTIIGGLSTDFILELMRVPHDGTFDMTSIYTKVLFIGMVGSVGFNTNAGILQGLGNSQTSLKFLSIAAVTNVALDILFVGPLNMGVLGAALATILSQILSFILGLIYLNSYYDYIKISFFNMPFDKSIFKKLMKIGIPSSIQNVAYSLGSMVLFALINSYGSDYMAGFTAANKIDMLVFLPIQSISNGVTTYMGQNMGAKKIDRVKNGVKASVILSVSVAIITGFGLLMFSEPILNLFSHKREVIDAGLEYLYPVLPAYSGLAILFCYSSILRGLEEGFIPMLVSIIGLLGARLPLSYFLAYEFGRQYIFYSYLGGWIVGGLIAVTYFYFGKYKYIYKNEEIFEE